MLKEFRRETQEIGAKTRDDQQRLPVLGASASIIAIITSKRKQKNKGEKENVVGDVMDPQKTSAWHGTLPLPFK